MSTKKKKIVEKRFKVYGERVTNFKELEITAEKPDQAREFYEEMMDKGDVLKTGEHYSVNVEPI